MIDSDKLNELAQRLAALLPKEAAVLKEDLEKNLKAALAAAFQKLDLVTREEFEVQKELLVRTRARLEALEQRVDALEQKLLAEE